MAEVPFKHPQKCSPARDLLDMCTDVAKHNFEREAREGFKPVEFHEDVDGEKLTLNLAGVGDDHIAVKINGKDYKFFPTGDMPPAVLAQKTAAIAKHSVGRALAWLKKNSMLGISHAGGVKTEIKKSGQQPPPVKRGMK